MLNLKQHPFVENFTLTFQDQPSDPEGYFTKLHQKLINIIELRNLHNALAKHKILDILMALSACRILQNPSQAMQSPILGHW